MATDQSLQVIERFVRMHLTTRALVAAVGTAQQGIGRVESKVICELYAHVAAEIAQCPLQIRWIDAGLELSAAGGTSSSEESVSVHGNRHTKVDRVAL